MPNQNPDLHGNVPDKADAALLLIDVPEDCVAAIEPRHHEAALEQMRATLKADTTRWADLDLDALARVPREGVEQSVR